VILPHSNFGAQSGHEPSRDIVVRRLSAVRRAACRAGRISVLPRVCPPPPAPGTAVAAGDSVFGTASSPQAKSAVRWVRPPGMRLTVWMTCRELA